ncbi:MAG TPA: molybdopterin-dependent oxidoreductase [Novosphingobium sp.]|nr:molybdopterin-dependent oxidoreductase [Novosphingobium sp.]
MLTVHRRTCHLCEASCGIVIEAEDRRIVSIKGDSDNPLSRGHICPKAVAIQDIQDDPDRLRRPLKRTATGWEEIGWDRAFAEIGERTREILLRHPHSATLFRGNPLSHHYGNALSARHLKSALQARFMVSAATMDQMPSMLVNFALYGHAALFPVPDIDRTGTMIIMGGNPVVSNGSLWTVPDFRARARALRERGGQLVTIDPRLTETGKIADRHIFVRPATDPWFLVLLIKQLFAHPRCPEPATYVRGLERLRAVIEPFSAEACAEICGSNLADIAWLADRMLQGPAAFYGRLGISVQEFGTLNAWLIAVINVIAGQLDREGGVMFSTPAVDQVSGAGGASGRWRSRVRGLPEVMGEIPVATLADEIETPGPGQIRALFVLAGNPVLSFPNGRRLEAALRDLDLLVSVDIYRNETSRLAHYILPPVGPLERDGYGMMILPLAVRNFANYSKPMFEPPSDGLLDWQIIRALAEAVSGEPVKAKTPPEQLDDMLRSGPHALSLEQLSRHPSGVDLGPLSAGRLPGRLQTTDKTLDCAPEPFCAELAKLAERRPEPADDKLLLIGRRHLRSNNSWMANSGRLSKGPNRCTALVNPTELASRGLTGGDEVEIVSRVGAITLPVEACKDIMPGVISVPHGWGHDKAGAALRTAASRPGASANELTDDAVVDSLSGNAVFCGVPVQLRRP